jgi:hypothetical protein
VASLVIDTSSELTAFFEAAVRGAAESRGYDPDAPSALYVVGVLSDYARPEALQNERLDRPLTFLLADALETAGPERFLRLRGLGDHVLYLSGFFADHLESCGAPPTFVRSVGAKAYDAAGAMLRRAGGVKQGPDVFDELASNFDELAHLLADVADTLYATSATNPRGVLDLYERWSKRGSPTLADALARAGIVPTRGKGLLH